jgi:photosystem II stability/assembly factor-like uncharacterized protein
MKYNIRFLTIVITALINFDSSSAQWKQTNGPLGGGVECIVTTETYVFAGLTSAGVVRSTLDGSSWSPMNSGLSNLNVRGLAVSGANIFAGVNGGGVFRSSDDGVTWSPVNAGLTTTFVYSIYSSGSAIYAGTYGSGMFRSLDNGSHWTHIDDGFDYANIWIDAFYASGTTILAATSAGLHRSIDNGATWTVVTDGFPIKTGYNAGFSMFAESGQYLILGSHFTGLYRSLDTGKTWSSLMKPVAKILPVGGGSTSCVFSVGGILYASVLTELIRSRDHGDSWERIDFGTLSADKDALPPTSMAASPKHLYGGTHDNGVLVADPSGTTWSFSNAGIRNANTTVLASSGATVIAGTYAGLSLSTNNGIEWSEPDPRYAVYAQTKFGKYLYIDSWRGMYRSPDDGKAWSAVGNGDTGIGDASTMAASGPYLFAGSNGRGVFRSADSGATWKQINTGLTNTWVTTLLVSGGDLYAGCDWGLFRSTDNGDHWTSISHQGLLNNNNVNALAVIDSNLFVGLFYPGSVYRSDLQGSQWTRVFIPPIAGDITALAVFGTSLFASGQGGIFLSEDRGNTWRAVTEGMTNLNVRAMTIAGPNLFAGCYYGGVWRRPVSEMLKQPVQDVYQLVQNYPNPFNGSTTIYFTVPRAERVSLKVYDLLGREIETIISEEFLAGSYSHQWNAASLPSGVYFYRLQAGSHIETKRLLVIK